MTIESLDLADIQLAARHAWRIVFAHPWRLIGCIVVLLFLVELPSYVPGIGYLARGALGSLLFAQTLVLFRDADRGENPNVFTLFNALSMPLSSQFVLVLSEWATFGIALAFLWQVGGGESVHKFFGEPYSELTLDASLYRQFRIVLFAVSAALTFLAPAIVLANVHGVAALRVALQAAARNPLFVLLLLCIDIALELGLLQLAQIGGFGTWINLLFLVPSLVYELALLYAASIRVFGLIPGPNAGPTTAPPTRP
jgi:hypothetical protein